MNKARSARSTLPGRRGRERRAELRQSTREQWESASGSQPVRVSQCESVRDPQGEFAANVAFTNRLEGVAECTTPH
jgi:hypothetical protein